MPLPVSLHLTRGMLGMLALLLGTAMNAAAETVVVTDSQNPVTTAVGVRVIYLDAPELIQEQLSAGLPKDPQLASIEVQRRMSGDRGQAISKRLREAHQGVADAWSWGVKKIPAIVINQQYVVYGNSDVGRAEALIAAYRSKGRP